MAETNHEENLSERTKDEAISYHIDRATGEDTTVEEKGAAMDALHILARDAGAKTKDEEKAFIENRIREGMKFGEKRRTVKQIQQGK